MRKTTLAVATFVVLILLPRVVPAFRNYVSLDPRDIPLVWDLPVPKAKEVETEQIRARRPGALFNDRFADYLAALTPARAGV